jgi:hypothetical protein
MASPNSTFTEMVTTTLRRHPTDIADNVSQHNALYRRLSKKGNVETISGGYEIVKPLDYAENSTYQRYSGYDALNIGASDVLSAAKYDWMQAAVHVTASGRELRMNSGREALINLTDARLKNAKRTAANNMSLDIYSDGALTNQMGGLAHIIQTNGQGTVGGINSTTYTFWRNQFREASGTNAVTAGNIKDEMMVLWLTCVRGNDKPDLIVSSHDYYTLFWKSLTDLQRYASADEAKLGFNALKFLDADVIFDNQSTNFTTTAEKMYFLNTNYLGLIAHSAANWNTLDEKMSTNQDAEVIPIIWQGNMVCSNRSLQGILLDAS